MTVTELSGWSVTSIESCVPGHGLVDGVVDDLVDEVMEAASTPVEPMYMPGPQTDRLEALEDGDVLGGICGVGCDGFRKC